MTNNMDKNMDKNMDNANNITFILGINRLPFELAYDIWQRYYTSTVLHEFINTTNVLETQLFNYQLDMQYTNKYNLANTYNLANNNSWDYMRKQFDEYFTFKC